MFITEIPKTGTLICLGCLDIQNALGQYFLDAKGVEPVQYYISTAEAATIIPTDEEVEEIAKVMRNFHTWYLKWDGRKFNDTKLRGVKS